MAGPDVELKPERGPLSWDYSVGAGGGNRTLMTSLEAYDCQVPAPGAGQGQSAIG